MSEMIDKVAIAIARSLQASGVKIVGGRTNDELDAISTAVARAAIEAMREPTEAMCDEGRACVPLSKGAAAVVFKSMIDAALT